MTLQKDLVESSYSVTLFETYFRPACNAFLYFCVVFLPPNNFINLHAVWGGGGGSFLNCPKFIKICPFLFKLYACPGSYADI